jgi:predicted ATPase
MRIRRLRLENWKNFRSVDVELPERAFLVGPNAAGKSNLLDAIRFLGEVARPGAGGLQAAVSSERRQGMSQIRSLHARTKSDVAIEVEVGTDASQWRYRLEMNADKHAAKVVREVVHRDGKVLLTRPSAGDQQDPALLAQTHLEQLSANAAFRPLAEFLARITYLHLVPQLLRDPQRFELVGGDRLGSDFLRRLANTPKKSRESRLRSICKAMQVAVPTLEQLQVENDKSGVPHLRGQFKHWRPNAGWQDERQFSDGTLRLVALLWILTEDQMPLLLEEPELSLNSAVVREIPRLLHRATQVRPRQILVSTHSADLLADRGIALEEILMVVPAAEGSRVEPASGRKDIKRLLDEGLDPGAAVLPWTAPAGMGQLPLPFPARA